MVSQDNNLGQNENIENYLYLKMLKYIGFNIDLSGRHQVVGRTIFLKRLPAFLCIAMGSCAAFSQVILITETMKSHDYYLATQVACHFFSNVLCLSKGYRTTTAVKQLNTVICELTDIWRMHVPRTQIRDNILQKASRIVWICRIFIAACCLGILSVEWPALRKLFLLYIHRDNVNYTIDYSQRVFWIKYPFEINDPKTYFYVVLEEQYLLFGCVLFWICGDTVFAQLTSHASLQFEILQHDISALMNDECSDAMLKRNLIGFITRHSRLLRICDLIDDIYSPIVLVAVVVSSINMCVNMFELGETVNTKQYVNACFHLVILTNTFLQMVFYCVFAETLTAQVSAIGDAMYNSNWTNKNYKFGMYVNMLIIKSQKPFQCTAFGFFPIGHVRLTVVLKTAFSYYMMLRSQNVFCKLGNGQSHNVDIEQYFSLNLKLLYCMGFNINLRESKIFKETKLLQKIPALIVIALEVYGCVCQVFLIVDAMEHRELFLVSRICSDFFSNILCFSKGIRLVMAIRKINSLLQELAAFWREYVPQHRIRQIILKKANNTKTFCHLFFMMIFVGVPSFSFSSLRNLVLLFVHRNEANNTCDYERIFFITYPFEIQSPMTYFFIILEEEYLLLGCVTFWACGDILFAQLTTHASLQFEILSDDIGLLMKKEKPSASLKRNFIGLIKRHKQLLNICDQIEDIYSPLVLITVILSAINICVNIFDLSETINTKDYATAGIHIFLLINTILEIGFYCIFSEALTQQIRAVGDAIYNSSWTDKDYNFGIYVYMLIIKSQNPFYCTAYGFFPIGHQRLTMVLNAAFSYYMMLLTTT
ncbi:uncharacterized protein LOC131664675 [Phymastichus coffea]|uniref:uncharacterized protein LOC131664675 n=1 Tax=Phymastichus coffea TaxID=108790 RepID=UPI00273B925C|nr:uncharacterized protein LOC131664675 [Phymastichus coffea]